MARTYRGMEDYYNSIIAEREAEEDQQWHNASDDASWPKERLFAVIGQRDFRIFRDPKGQQVLLPEATATNADWWILIVRDRREEYRHWGAYPTVGAAMRAAEQLWEGPKLR